MDSSHIFTTTTLSTIGANMKTVHSSMTASTMTFSLVVEHPQITFVRETYAWLVPLMIAILLVAIIGNSLIVISSPWLSPPVTPYLRLCVSLAAADMWAASLLTAGLVVNSYLSMVLRVQKSTDCFAAILEVFRIGGMLTSDLHLFALAINQFVGITWPLKYKVLMTTKRIRATIVVLWLAPVFFTLAWFLAFENDGLRHPKCHHRFYLRMPFRLTIFIIFMVPLLATLSIYAMILFTLFKAKFKYSDDLLRKTQGTRSQLQGKIKLVWTTLLIVSTFSLSWGLCVLYFVLVCRHGCTFIYGQSIDFYVGFYINSTVNGLVMIKLVINPFVYALRLAHIRASVVSFVRFAIGRSYSKPNSPAVAHSQQQTITGFDGAVMLLRKQSKTKFRQRSQSLNAQATRLAVPPINYPNENPAGQGAVRSTSIELKQFTRFVADPNEISDIRLKSTSCL